MLSQINRGKDLLYNICYVGRWEAMSAIAAGYYYDK